MKDRLKLVGWWMIALPSCLLFCVLTITLFPLWAIIWVLTGWWFFKEGSRWIEATFPVFDNIDEIIAADH
jgi:hypothetical protein